MNDDQTSPPDSKLTHSKQRWAREGKFLTGRIARPDEQRLPPGQHLTQRLAGARSRPVAERSARERWRLDVYGAVDAPLFWDLAQFMAQPQSDFVSDIHCVTTWSRYDNQLGGACRPATCSTPAGRATRRASWCCIRMTATPPISRWRISPPRTR